MQKASLYHQLGEDLIIQVITEFYHRAFEDRMIGHFFFNKDKDDITKKQIAFAIAMLGGPRHYKGKSLPQAHDPLAIRPPHFGRRQVLMGEVLQDLKVPHNLAQSWLDLEAELKPIILKLRIQSQPLSER